MASQNFGCHNEKASSDVNTHHVMLHEYKQLTINEPRAVCSFTGHPHDCCCESCFIYPAKLSLLLAWRGNEKVIKKSNKALGLILVHVNFVS